MSYFCVLAIVNNVVISMGLFFENLSNSFGPIADYDNCIFNIFRIYHAVLNNGYIILLAFLRIKAL